MAIISVGTRPETDPLFVCVAGIRLAGSRQWAQASNQGAPRRTRSQSHHIRGGVISSDACTMYHSAAARPRQGVLGDDGWEGCEGCVVSSDQHRPWVVIPGLAQHPQAAGQTHTQFVTTPAGRLGPGISVWISCGFPLDHPHILHGCSSGDLMVQNAPVLPPPIIPKVNKLPPRRMTTV